MAYMAFASLLAQAATALFLFVGEKYFTVNDYDKLRFMYIPSAEYKKRYFKHIEWEELKIVEFK